MGLFARLKGIAARSLEAEVDGASDPEAAVRALLGEMRAGLAEARVALATSVRDELRLARDVAAARAEVDRWHANARQALEAAREDLAREALVRRAKARQFAEQLERERRRLTEALAQLKRYVFDLDRKMREAQARERVLLSRRRRVRQAEALAERFPERRQQLLKAALEDLDDDVTRDALKGPLLDEDPVEREFRRLKKRKALPAADVDEELERLKRELEDRDDGGSHER